MGAMMPIRNSCYFLDFQHTRLTLLRLELYSKNWGRALI